MPQTNAERDMQRASELRKLAKEAVNGKAKADFNEAADRLERRAARKAKALGRTKRKPVNEYMR